MTGFLSSEPLVPNRIERERQRLLRAGMTVLDLTDSNPTHLSFPPALLAKDAAEYFRRRRYEPAPKGRFAARAVVASYYAERGLDISPEQIFLTASTSESYRLLFSLLCDAQDEVLIPSVTYPLFELLAHDARITVRSYPLDEAREWSIVNLEPQDRTRAVLVMSPHNPTGAIIHNPIAALTHLHLPLISDEVFAEFSWRERSAPPLGCFHPERPVFHLNGISKMFALPDLKLGWIALNDAAAELYGERLEFLNDIYLGANQLAQDLLPRLFAEGREFVALLRAHYQANLSLAVSALQQSGLCTLRPPAGGPYLFPRLAASLDEEELVLSLLAHGVFVHPGFFYGCDTGVHIMLSCVPPKETLEAGLELLIRAISSKI